MRPGTEYAIGVDVGGTHIRAARISPSGAVDGHISEPVKADRAGFTTQILRMIKAVRNEGCSAVGVGIPGRVRGGSGEILSAGYLDIAALNLAEQIRTATGLSTQIENDATMALLAEARARDGVTGGVMMMMTIGTGIGGAILENGVPWHGGGVSGQFGHIVVAADGPLCKCGRRGCVETFSSGTALSALTKHADRPGIRAETLLCDAERGDAVAAQILDDWARPMARAIETLVAVADPRCIVIGGGLGAEMARALGRLPRHDLWFGFPIEPAILGDNAGVVGAGLCAMRAGAGVGR